MVSYVTMDVSERMNGRALEQEASRSQQVQKRPEGQPGNIRLRAAPPRLPGKAEGRPWSLREPLSGPASLLGLTGTLLNPQARQNRQEPSMGGGGEANWARDADFNSQDPPAAKPEEDAEEPTEAKSKHPTPHVARQGRRSRECRAQSRGCVRPQEGNAGRAAGNRPSRPCSCNAPQGAPPPPLQPRAEDPPRSPALPGGGEGRDRLELERGGKGGRQAPQGSLPPPAEPRAPRLLPAGGSPRPALGGEGAPAVPPQELGQAGGGAAQLQPPDRSGCSGASRCFQPASASFPSRLAESG